ncbi:hypothetical protein HDG32_003670 [Paraburkholderia sp. CI2]|uniref:hypothetical protein n=1 Tax=Paraburkholderia sp. CI2 TaxID=2723093 RepID=UPI001618C0A6|nr:hypothetical protein [Paraburkholderia sp. CI2]MBB5467547.1 hypothetical protein [Paraburkholderia sp. CI2]
MVYLKRSFEGAGAPSALGRFLLIAPWSILAAPARAERDPERSTDFVDNGRSRKFCVARPEPVSNVLNRYVKFPQYPKARFGDLGSR